MSDTLVLNADGNPYSILPLSAINWQDAIRYMVLDKVHVLEWYDDWMVSSPTWETKVPAVIMVKKFVKKNSNVRFSKFNVMLRDNFECQYCSVVLTRSTATMDHVVPVSKGGKTSFTNVVTACNPCNSTKSDRTDIKPKKEPVMPTYFDLVKNKRSLDIAYRHPSWQKFLS